MISLKQNNQCSFLCGTEFQLELPISSKDIFVSYKKENVQKKTSERSNFDRNRLAGKAFCFSSEENITLQNL